MNHDLQMMVIVCVQEDFVQDLGVVSSTNCLVFELSVHKPCGKIFS